MTTFRNLASGPPSIPIPMYASGPLFPAPKLLHRLSPRCTDIRPCNRRAPSSSPASLLLSLRSVGGDTVSIWALHRTVLLAEHRVLLVAAHSNGLANYFVHQPPPPPPRSSLRNASFSTLSQLTAGPRDTRVSILRHTLLGTLEETGPLLAIRRHHHHHIIASPPGLTSSNAYQTAGLPCTCDGVVASFSKLDFRECSIGATIASG